MPLRSFTPSDFASLKAVREVLEIQAKACASTALGLLWSDWAEIVMQVEAEAGASAPQSLAS